MFAVAVEVACARARQEGARRAVALPVSAPFHCSLMAPAAEKLALSARAYQRVQRVARTIADLAGEETIRKQHLAEALALRIPGKRTSGAGSGLWERS